jgi:hypothetical protein
LGIIEEPFSSNLTLNNETGRINARRKLIKERRERRMIPSALRYYSSPVSLSLL